MFKVGDVLYLKNKSIIPNKSKYSICVHIRPNYFLLINSENRPFYDCLKIEKKDNSFLKHDSYIGCANYFVYEDYELKGKNIIGSLGYKDLYNLYNHIKNNVKRMPRQAKNEILLSLESVLEDYI